MTAVSTLRDLRCVRACVCVCVCVCVWLCVCGCASAGSGAEALRRQCERGAQLQVGDEGKSQWHWQYHQNKQRLANVDERQEALRTEYNVRDANPELRTLQRTGQRARRLYAAARGRLHGAMPRRDVIVEGTTRRSVLAAGVYRSFQESASLPEY